jgi:small subunit ribosomal protein S1
MADKHRRFRDDAEDTQRSLGMSDADLEALMARAERRADRQGAAKFQGSARGIEDLEPGTRLRGIVIDVRGGEVLVELDSKNLGVVEEGDFEGGEVPKVGSTLEASLVRYDPRRELVVLSAGAARKQVFWEDLRPGIVLEGLVTAVNKGGLTLDVKGVRAFLPISQIERQRVEDASSYVGKKLRCEVTSVDRQSENVVVSRRVVLDREAEELRGKALARLREGEVLEGTVTRLSEHGAFIDLGGVEGLLHQSKITARRNEFSEEEPLRVGKRLEVEVVRVDAERGRVGLDFRRVSADTWNVSIEGYEVGDEVTGWVTKLTPEHAVLGIAEGVEGLLARRHLVARREPLQRGNILKARITGIDLEKRSIELEPADEPRRA